MAGAQTTQRRADAPLSKALADDKARVLELGVHLLAAVAVLAQLGGGWRG